MLHQLIRYRPVIDAINDAGVSSALEVGSGSGGLARFVDTSITGVDVDFSDYTGETRERPENIKHVMADAARLPFRDSSFDIVFSCDMLEHVPAGKRPGVVAEMVRVAAKKVVLVYPCGSLASACDALLRKACLSLGRKVPGWLDEHVGLDLPTREEGGSILRGMGIPFTMRGNAFIPLHYLLLVLESVRGIRALFSEMSYRQYRTWTAGGMLSRLFVSVVVALSVLPPAYRVSVEISKK